MSDPWGGGKEKLEAECGEKPQTEPATTTESRVARDSAGWGRRSLPNTCCHYSTTD